MKKRGKKDNNFLYIWNHVIRQIVVLSWQIHGQKRSFRNKHIMRIFLLNQYSTRILVKKGQQHEIKKLPSLRTWI